MPSLTTDQKIETIAGFDIEKFYDAKQYYTLGGKLKAVAPRVIWKNVNRNFVTSIKLPMTVRSKVKRANPYTLCGVIVFVPDNNSPQQHGNSGFYSDINHITCSLTARYLEWNDGFDMERV